MDDWQRGNSQSLWKKPLEPKSANQLRRYSKFLPIANLGNEDKGKYKRKIKSFVRRAALSLGLMTRLWKTKKKTAENQLNEWNNLSLENQQPNRFDFIFFDKSLKKRISITGMCLMRRTEPRLIGKDPECWVDFVVTQRPPSPRHSAVWAGYCISWLWRNGARRRLDCISLVNSSRFHLIQGKWHTLVNRICLSFRPCLWVSKYFLFFFREYDTIAVFWIVRFSRLVEWQMTTLSLVFEFIWRGT